MQHAKLHAKSGPHLHNETRHKIRMFLNESFKQRVIGVRVTIEIPPPSSFILGWTSSCRGDEGLAAVLGEAADIRAADTFLSGRHSIGGQRFQSSKWFRHLWLTGSSIYISSTPFKKGSFVLSKKLLLCIKLTILYFQYNILIIKTIWLDSIICHLLFIYHLVKTAHVTFQACNNYGNKQINRTTSN